MAGLHEEILSELRKCVDRSQSLDAFRQWFVPISWDIEQAGEGDAIALAHRLDGILAEASSAEWTDADLLHQMADLVREQAKSYDEVRKRPPLQIVQS
jgi:hypothetical protein